MSDEWLIWRWEIIQFEDKRLRRDRDSNPRYPVKDTTVFETAPIGRSGISPALIRGCMI
jgi:hypothetical protein